MGVADKIKEFKEELPCGVEMVAVSKFHPVSKILEAYEAGQRLFGESRVQEFLEKEKTLPKDIRWHFIGHLQSNKVKQLIGKTAIIESIDSEKLLNLINAESVKAGVVTEVLLQIHVAAEETKFGFSVEEAEDFFNKKIYTRYPYVKIRGLMGMATNTDDEERVKKDFSTLHNLFEKIRSKRYPDLEDFDRLSMGMSGDWKLAVAEGSNIIRIGSAIFGERN